MDKVVYSREGREKSVKTNGRDLQIERLEDLILYWMWLVKTVENKEIIPTR